MRIEKTSNFEFKTINDTRNKKYAYAIGALLVVLILSAIGFLFLSNAKSSNTQSSSNNLTNTVAATKSNTSTSTPISTTVVQTTTTSTTETLTPTTTSITGTTTVTTPTTTPSSNSSSVSGPTTFKSTEFAFNITIPEKWILKSQSMTNRSCDLSKDFLRNTCTGTINSEMLTMSQTDDGVSFITIEGATTGIGFQCSSEEKSTIFFVYVKGEKYEFDTCSNFNGQFSGQANLKVAGSSSKWNTVVVNWKAKDRATVDSILDILATIS
jgi:hypothetical protein